MLLSMNAARSLIDSKTKNVYGQCSGDLYLQALLYNLTDLPQEAFEEEEELEGGQQGDDGLLDFSGGSTQAKQEEEEAGKASQSAVQESLAKLNPTKNSTKVCASIWQ